MVRPFASLSSSCSKRHSIPCERLQDGENPSWHVLRKGEVSMRRSHFKAVLALISGFLVAGPRCVAQGKPSTRLAGIKTVSIELMPLPRLQPCPVVVRFRGMIEASRAGLLRYRLRLNDGGTTPLYRTGLADEERRVVMHSQRVGTPTDTTAAG